MGIEIYSATTIAYGVAALVSLGAIIYGIIDEIKRRKLRKKFEYLNK